MKKIMSVVLAMAICFSFAAVSSAESYLIINKDMRESRVGLGFSIPIPFFGEGKNTSYKTRNEDSEFHVAGLASAPKIYGKSQEAYFEKYDGSLKSLKEFGHGLTSIVHIYNTKSNGSKKFFPGFFTLEKEGSVFAPILGLVAFPVNVVSKLSGSEFRMYNAWVKNPLRTLGTTVLLVGSGVAIGSSGGGGSSDGSTPEETELELVDDLPPSDGDY